MTGLRVGLVCPYDLDVPGGVREQVLGLARALELVGHDCEVLAPRGRPGRGQGPHARRVPELVDGVRVRDAGPAVGVPTNGSTARLAVGPLARARAAAWAGSGFDVVHVHEPIPPGIGHAVMRRLARERERTGAGPAVLATVHVSMDPAPAGRSRRLRTAAGHVSTVLRGVDVLTAVSEQARRTLVDHLGRLPLVQPNGVDVSGWAQVARGVGAGSPDAPPTVVVVGRADEPRKGVDVLLAGWPRVRAAVPDARLLVVGPVRARGGRRALVAPAGVELVGEVDEARKRALVASADLLVAPHRGGESFGIVLVEAMASGVPVVASDLPAFRGVLAGTGLLVTPGDVTALADAVVAVLLGLEQADGHDPRPARRRAATFDWPVVAAGWEQLYALAVRVRGGHAQAGAELDRALRERSVAALRLAADGVVGPAPEAGWRHALAELARAAADPTDLAAQSRLSAAAGSDLLPPGVRDRLADRTRTVAQVRALLNDLATRDGLATVELDDHVGVPAVGVTPAAVALRRSPVTVGR